MPKKPDAPDYFWFQPLRVLFEEAGAYTEQFQFWESVIGGSEAQDLYFTEDFCALGDPVEIEWTFENFAMYGSEVVLKTYAQHVLFNRYCTSGGGG